MNKLSQAGVNHLINMKKLHTLHFVDIFIKNSNHIPEFIIAVAGEVPSLRNMDFRHAKNHNQFIEEFGEKYPNKKLMVKKIVYVPFLIIPFLPLAKSTEVLYNQKIILQISETKVLFLDSYSQFMLM